MQAHWEAIWHEAQLSDVMTDDMRARCLALLEPLKEEAWRAIADDLQTGMLANDWLIMYMECRYARIGDGPPRIGADEALELLRSWGARLLRNPAAPGDMAWRLVFQQSFTLWRLGLHERAMEALRAQVDERLRAWLARPDDPVLKRELMSLPGWLSGSIWRPGEADMVQALVDQRLGPDHQLSLLMVRTRAYHARYLGRPREAVALMEQAMERARAHHGGDRLFIARMAEEQAACWAAAGRVAEGMEQHRQVLTAFEELRPGEHGSLLRLHSNMAGFAMEVGDWTAAIVHAEAAMRRAAELPDNRSVQGEGDFARVLRETARLNRGDEGAPQALRDALAAVTVGEMHAGSPAVELLMHAVKVGDKALLQWAADFVLKHLAAFRGSLQFDSALRPLTQAWLLAGAELADPRARSLLEEAMTLGLNGRSAGTQALTSFKLARHLSGSDPDTAIWLYKLGANALQRMRGGLPPAEGELMRAWLSAYEADLRHFIGLLIDSGRLPEAEQAMANLGDEEVYEFTRRSPVQALRGRAGAALSYNGLEAVRTAQLQTLSAEAEQATRAADLRMDARRQFSLMSGYHDAQADADRGLLQQRLHALLEPAAPVFKPGPAAGAAARRPAPGTVRLLYFLREQGLDVLVQTHTQGTLRQRLPVTPAALNRLVQAARVALQSPQFDALPALQDLYGLLLRPLEAHWRRAGVRQVEVVPDGSLRYLPFAALHDGQRYAAQRVVWTTAWPAVPVPPAVAAAVGRGPSAKPQLVALGRTVGDAEHAALPGVLQEMEAAARAGAVVNLDQAFTAESLARALAGRPRAVHLASHFALDPGGAERSYLLLGDGRKLSLAELARLPWAGVDLAMLSACDSGVAADGGNGQPWMGFAQLLQGAGVRHILATLWRVGDAATAEWMAQFYRAAGRPVTAGGAGSTPWQATPQNVAQVQRQWLAQYAGAAWAHPHYWAAFSWVGGN